MDDDIREFGLDLGRKAIARDWAGVHAHLAPWMGLTVADVQAFFEDEYRQTLTANGIADLHHPGYPEPEVGGNTFMNATELRKPIEWAGDKVRPVAPEVTDANVRFWMKLQLPCSDEQMETLGFDVFCEVWLAVVDAGSGLRVGYWSHGAY